MQACSRSASRCSQAALTPYAMLLFVRAGPVPSPRQRGTFNSSACGQSQAMRVFDKEGKGRVDYVEFYMTVTKYKADGWVEDAIVQDVLARCAGQTRRLLDKLVALLRTRSAPPCEPMHELGASVSAEGFARQPPSGVRLARGRCDRVLCGVGYGWGFGVALFIARMGLASVVCRAGMARCTGCSSRWT